MSSGYRILDLIIVGRRESHVHTDKWWSPRYSKFSKEIEQRRAQRAFQQKQQQKQRRQFPFEVTVVAILLQRHTSPYNLYVTSETQMSF